MMSKLSSTGGLVILFWVTSLGLADTTWTGAGDGSSWTDPANWSNGLPDGQRRIFINGVSTVNIGPAVNDTINRLFLADGAASDDVVLNMWGGSLNITLTMESYRNLELATVGNAKFHMMDGVVNVGRDLRMGVDPGPAASGVATLTMDGGSINVARRLYGGYGTQRTAIIEMNNGTITADQFFLADAPGSTGTLVMTGGIINAGDFWTPTNLDAVGGTAHVQLDGGTINVSRTFHLTNDSGLGIRGTMDVRGGTLMVRGDQTAALTGYVSSGWLTGYGFADTGHVVITYDSVADTTTVTAQPDVNCYILPPDLPTGAPGVPYVGTLQAAPGCTGATWTVSV